MNNFIIYPYCLYYKVDIDTKNHAFYPVAIVNKTTFDKETIFEINFDFDFETGYNTYLHYFICTKDDKELFNDIIKFFAIYIESRNKYNYDLIMKIYKKSYDCLSNIRTIKNFIKNIYLLIEDDHYYENSIIDTKERQILVNIKKDLLDKDTLDILYYQSEYNKNMQKLNQINIETLPSEFIFRRFTLDRSTIEIIFSYIQVCKNKDYETKELIKKDIINKRINIFFDDDFNNNMINKDEEYELRYKKDIQVLERNLKIKDGLIEEIISQMRSIKKQNHQAMVSIQEENKRLRNEINKNNIAHAKEIDKVKQEMNIQIEKYMNNKCKEIKDLKIKLKSTIEENHKKIDYIKSHFATKNKNLINIINQLKDKLLVAQDEINKLKTKKRKIDDEDDASRLLTNLKNAYKMRKIE